MNPQPLHLVLSKWAQEEANTGVPWKVILLPWQINSLSVAPGLWSRVLAGLLSEQARLQSNHSVVPLLVDALELANCTKEKISPFLAGKAGLANTYRISAFYSHLANGTILLILTGLTDMEINLEQKAYGEML